MSYTIQRLPGEPIIINTLAADFNVSRDALPSLQETFTLVEEIGGPVYSIMDVRQLSISFSDLVLGMGMLTRGEMALFTDPRLRLIAVGASGLAAMGAKALSQAQYGNLSVHLCDTVDEAIAYAREQVAGG